MPLYHVTTAKKLQRYIERGSIRAPVRAWKSVAAAERFSKQTGRRIILRLSVRGEWVPYVGHCGEAMVRHTDVPLKDAVY